MEVKRVAAKILKYAMRESEELFELRVMVDDLHQLFTLDNEDRKRKLLQGYFKRKIKKEDRLVVRIERHMDVWIRRLQKLLSEEDENEENREFIEEIQTVHQHLDQVRAALVTSLAQNGKLAQLVQQEKWEDVEKEIENILGTNETIGLRQLILLVQEMENGDGVSSKKGAKQMYLHLPTRYGVFIPYGLVPADEWKKLHPNESPPEENIRWLESAFCKQLPGRPKFVKEDSPELDAFLKKCKSYTKDLAKKLESIRKDEDLLVYFGLGRRNKGKWIRQVRFHITGPFFSSEESKSEENRWQSSDKRDEFYLHFDQRGNLHAVRYWDSSNWKVNHFRGGITKMIKSRQNYISAHFGSWEMEAKYLFLCVKKALEIMSINSQEDFEV